MQKLSIARYNNPLDLLFVSFNITRSYFTSYDSNNTISPLERCYTKDRRIDS